jgi:hypothetical protein
MAYEFNGTNQSMATASTPVTVAPMTLACWFNSDNSTVAQRLIEVRSSTLNYFSLGLRGQDASDPVAIAISEGGSTEITRTTSGYFANTWHHACGVFASTTSRSVYIDGGSSATGTGTRSPATPNTIQIGIFAVDNTQYFDGRMAEIGIWNAALTPAEIASLAKGMTCDKVRPQSLVFYAPLVRELIDQKGGRTITNNNGATVANHPRVYA